MVSGRFFELQYRAHGCFDGSYLFALSSFSHLKHPWMLENPSMF